ncbi:MAG: hypothetical protein KJ970_17025 [Candidatus Eisenbacteria bacterium]|uniref:Uncharacterized protein n=1 Tax=Eiseniibacteriota bacterium TaxID=2212470 RepID=A0A948W7U4_UNCEI|nr:hypothetical protein [Candidatus Eisenbacteria bacterium]
MKSCGPGPQPGRIIFRRVIWVLFLTGLFSLSIPAGAWAASPKDLRNTRNDMSQNTNRARGLILTILKEIKTIDQNHRDPSGQPLPAQKAEARKSLGRLEPIHTSFTTCQKEASRLMQEFNTGFARLKDSSGEVQALQREMNRYQSEMEKLGRYLKKYYQGAVDDFGPPIQPVTGGLSDDLAPVRGPKGMRIKGEVGGMAGSASYKRPHANPKVDLSSGQLNFNVKGSLIPSETTAINFHGSHESKIEQKKIGLTKLGAGVQHQVQEDLAIRAQLDYSGYSDDKEDFRNFGDVSFAGGVNYETPRLQAAANLNYMKRSYGKAKNANFNILSFQPNVILPVGTGKAKFGIDYLKKSNEIELFNHREVTPYATWLIAGSGSSINLRYEQFTHTEVDKSPLDNNRLKASYYNQKNRPAGSVIFGPEVALYRYPNAEDNNFSDFALMYQKQDRGRKISIASWRAVYRAYSDTTKFDFAQITFRRSSRPMGSGADTEMNIAARYYTEESNKDDPLRFANVHPPHTLDYYHSIGWTGATSGALRNLTIGPIWGATFHIDTERNDAFDNDIDYILTNPANSALGGIQARAQFMATPALRIRGDGLYKLRFYYNAEPKRKLARVEIKLSGLYSVNPQVEVEGWANIRLTTADTDAAGDLQESDIAVRVRYLFDVVQ